MYVLWKAIRVRCNYTKADNYRFYGAKGIKVHSAWSDYQTFKDDVERLIGPHPGKGWELDRVESTGDYEPGNIRWATREQQNRNASSNIRVTIGGETRCVTDWVEHFAAGVAPETARQRIKMGWPPLDAFTLPNQNVKGTGKKRRRQASSQDRPV